MDDGVNGSDGRWMMVNDLGDNKQRRLLGLMVGTRYRVGAWD